MEVLQRSLMTMGEETYIVHVTVNRWQQSLFSLVLSVTKFLILERTEVSERSFSFVLCEGTVVF